MHRERARVSFPDDEADNAEDDLHRQRLAAFCREAVLHDRLGATVRGRCKSVCQSFREGTVEGKAAQRKSRSARRGVRLAFARLSPAESGCGHASHRCA
jgi:hypothetical protein